MKQIIPKRACLTCDVCCRFLESQSHLRPIFLEKERETFKNLSDNEGRVILKEYNSLYICPFFSPEENICRIYKIRPFDCRLYPFIVTYNENKNRIILCVDTKCPFVKDNGNFQALKFPKEFIDLLEDKKTVDEILKVPDFIGYFHRDYLPIAILNRLTTRVIHNPQGSGYKKLALEDREIFDKQFERFNSAHYSFINLYIWKDIIDVWWKRIDGKLNILFDQGGGLIEFDKIKKFKEYVYLRKDLAELRGDRFKHKRSSYNLFVKNSNYKYLPYKNEMKLECLELFSKWAKERKQRYKDPYYQRLIDDSLCAHKIAMEEFESLGLIGRVVKVDGRISAYTFGFELNKETFCILFEIADLNIKGLSQFIFREFCKELIPYKYINLMDDSRLENLRRVKESYHPIL